MMDEEMRKRVLEEMRKFFVLRFRHTFYKDVKFPFLHSMGCHDVFQSFHDKSVGFVGMLHLKWCNKEWKEIWYDIEEEGIKKAEEAYSSNLICDEKLNGVLKRFHDSLKIVKEQNEENAILN